MKKNSYTIKLKSFFTILILFLGDILSYYLGLFSAYYTRDYLDLKTRELLTFAMLISLGGCKPQVKGHIQGNINMGNDKEFLIEAVTQLLPYIGYPRVLNALNCINEVA